MLCSRVKTETDQNARRARGRRMGIDRDQPLVDIRQTVHILTGFAFCHQTGALDIGQIGRAHV